MTYSVNFLSDQAYKKPSWLWGRMREKVGLCAFDLSVFVDLTRLEIAYTILRSLRVSSMASVVDQLWPLFHKDPVAYFPPEIVSLIFSYLEPRDLMDASRASRTWRARVLDSRLWKEKFRIEGWGLDTEEIDRFERQYNLPKPPMSSTSTKNAQDRTHTKQATHEVITPSESSIALNDATDSSHVGDIMPKWSSNEPGEDEEMPDASCEASASEFPKQTQNMVSIPAQNSSDLMGSARTRPGDNPNKEEQLMLYAAPGHSRLNYHYIFKQKRKLEENWNAGRYRNFQLPHKDHPSDAHTECVYTIQYLGKHLVSGSRDRTLRIWDLDTLRLARPPLQGHLGSVLCLQFDNQEEDIIISGSSDCQVIVWCFSTGQKLKHLANAHKESVLNLRFDKRFLVTCSKDKTIKIWNRQDLTPASRNYPVKGSKGGGHCPSYIIDSVGIPDALKYGPSKPEHRMRLEAYTHIMTLDLHVAAVNAIQIYEDQLVSASGDRCLRIWDIHTGECTTKIEAHQKGIACLQYDGKRIVSGSSDNTIRIWDPISKVEVARLEGHNRLVRTIQAAFVDVPGGRERLGTEAADIERQFHLAHEAGEIPERSRRDPPARPGSRKPRDLRAINAKIPPSGGGSRWSHIVSGSYDETVLIWKKTVDDEWVIGHTLRQEEALIAAGPKLVAKSEQVQDGRAPGTQAGGPRQRNFADFLNGATGPPAYVPTVATLTGPAPIPTPHPQGNGQPLASTHPQQNINIFSTAAADGWNNPIAGPSWSQPNNPPIHNDANGPRPAQQSSEAPVRHAINSPNQTDPNPPSRPRMPPNRNHANVPPGPGQSLLPRPNPSYLQQNLQAHGGRLANAGPAGQANGGGILAGQPNARVFKLQFDARRIICCSQDPKIVGWDFANDDPQIMECSRFFSAPQ